MRLRDQLGRANIIVIYFILFYGCSTQHILSNLIVLVRKTVRFSAPVKSFTVIHLVSRVVMLSIVIEDSPLLPDLNTKQRELGQKST